MLADHHITKLNPDSQGFDEILVIQDRLSKTIFLEPAKSTDTVEITWLKFTYALEKAGGLPDMLITDNGTKVGAEFKRRLAIHNVQHALTTTYHPQTNGGTERTNSSTITNLRKYRENENWLANLTACEHAQIAARRWLRAIRLLQLFLDSLET